ncbi:MAG: BatD family protein [Phycisphaerales bacterium]
MNNRSLKPKRHGVLIGCLLSLIWAAAAALGQEAPQIRVEASLDRDRVFVGQPANLQITVDGSRTPEEPDIPQIDGAEIESLGGRDQTSSFTTIVNGRVTEQRFDGYIFFYQVTPTSAGRISIPPMAVRVNGVEYRSNPVVFTAIEPEEIDDLKLRLQVSDPAPFVGEPVELNITIYLKRGVRNASIRLPNLEDQFDLLNPVDTTPGPNDIVLSFLGRDTPARRSRERLDGEIYDAFTITKYVVPRAAGAVTVGPATLAGHIVVREARSLFDRDVVDQIVAPSNAVDLMVRPLPKDDRSARETGIVGDFTIKASAAPLEVNVGDPIELVIEITTRGAATPQIPFDLGRQAAFGERFLVSDAPDPPEIVGRRLILRRTIRPRFESVDEIPSIELTFFDPDAEEYRAVATDPIPLRVRKTRVVTADDAIGGADSGGAGASIESSSGGLAHNIESNEALEDHGFDWSEALRSPPVIAALAGPPIAWLATALALAARRRRDSQHPARRRRLALHRAKAALTLTDEPIEIRGPRAVRSFIAERFEQHESALTVDECVSIASTWAPAAAARLRGILERLEAARFGGERIDSAGEMTDSIVQALREINDASESQEVGR